MMTYSEWRKRRTCSRKMPYDSIYHAQLDAQDKDLVAYRCPYCNSFHLTSHGTSLDWTTR